MCLNTIESITLINKLLRLPMKKTILILRPHTSSVQTFDLMEQQGM